MWTGFNSYFLHFHSSLKLVIVFTFCIPKALKGKVGRGRMESGADLGFRHVALREGHFGRLGPAQSDS